MDGARFATTLPSLLDFARPFRFHLALLSLPVRPAKGKEELLLVYCTTTVKISDRKCPKTSAEVLIFGAMVALYKI